MAATRETDRARNAVSIEWRGDLSTDEIHRLVDEFAEAGMISGITVEIPTDQSIEALVQFSTELEQPRTDMDATGTDAANTEAAQEDELADGDEESRSTRLHVDGTPYKVMRILDAHGSWLRTAEIRDAVPEEWDVNPETLGTTLSNLADRELVDKRPYEADKRQTEYRITARGKDAVQATHARAEAQDETDVDAVSDEEIVAAVGK